MTENVKVWEEDILLPTYGIGKQRSGVSLSGSGKD